MKPHLKYFSYVMRHKWFVFVAGYRLQVPILQLIIHDWSKFTRAEWFPYVAKFYGDHTNGDGDLVRAEFRAAFRLHESRNPHHWQHWMKGPVPPQEMPINYILEMIADWMGAGRAINGKWEVAEWYEANKNVIQLAPKTRSKVEFTIRTKTKFHESED